MDTKLMLSPAQAIPRSPGADNGTIKRLLVLLPDEDIDEASLANVLWTMAARNGAGIHVVAAIQDWASEPQAQLRLGLLTALLRESGLETETEIVQDAELLRVAVERRRPGDIVICPAGTPTPDGRASLIPALHPLTMVFSPLAPPVPPVELRSMLCRDLGLNADDLRFVAELIAVKPEETAWEASIEKVLNSFALSMLVPARLYASVSAYVDRTRLTVSGRGQRLVY